MVRVAFESHHSTIDLILDSLGSWLDMEYTRSEMHSKSIRYYKSTYGPCIALN